MIFFTYSRYWIRITFNRSQEVRLSDSRSETKNRAEMQTTSRVTFAFQMHASFSPCGMSLRKKSRRWRLACVPACDAMHRYFRRHANRTEGYVGIFGTSRDAPRKPRYVKRRWRETVEKNYCAAVPRSPGPRGLRFDRFSAPMSRRCA